MMLNAEEKRRYAEDGYLVLPRVLGPADLEPLRQSIAEFVDLRIRKLQAAGKVGDPTPRLHLVNAGRSSVKRIIYRRVKTGSPNGERKADYSTRRFTT